MFTVPRPAARIGHRGWGDGGGGLGWVGVGGWGPPIVAIETPSLNPHFPASAVLGTLPGIGIVADAHTQASSAPLFVRRLC